MGDIFGTDFMEAKPINIDMGFPEVAVSFDAPAPNLIPSLASVGPVQTSDGFNNMNAGPYLPTSKPASDEHAMREKYELLNKFKRLAKNGVPIRKNFTLDSPLEEMRTELEYIKKEKNADSAIARYSSWYVNGMSLLEKGSETPFLKAFGLNLKGLSEAAYMNVGEMQDDFEELHDMYGDILKLHPALSIAMRTAMAVMTVHYMNHAIQSSPMPDLGQVLRNNPHIAQQLASASMQQQMKPQPAPQPQIPVQNANPLAGLTNFMNSMIPPPPPQQTNVRPPPTSVKPAIKLPKVQPAQHTIAPPPSIDDLLKSVGVPETKKVTMTPRKAGSTGKNSVTIKL